MKKSFAFAYRRTTNDRNGNSRHWVNIYQVKRNVPVLIAHNVKCGCLGKKATVLSMIVRLGLLPADKAQYGSKWVEENTNITELEAI